MKFCLCSRSYELQLYVNKYEATYTSQIVAVLFIILIKNFRLCSSAEAGIVLKF